MVLPGPLLLLRKGGLWWTSPFDLSPLNFRQNSIPTCRFSLDLLAPPLSLSSCEVCVRCRSVTCHLSRRCKSGTPRNSLELITRYGVLPSVLSVTGWFSLLFAWHFPRILRYGSPALVLSYSLLTMVRFLRWSSFWVHLPARSYCFQLCESACSGHR